jgi:hypothetical protein
VSKTWPGLERATLKSNHELTNAKKFEAMKIRFKGEKSEAMKKLHYLELVQHTKEI